MKNKVILLILVAIIILFAVLAVLFAYKYINVKESLADLNSQIDTLNNELNSNKEEAVEKEVQEKYIIPKFDYEKGATYNDENFSYDGYACYTDTGVCYIEGNTANFQTSSSNEEYTYTIDENIIDAVRTWVNDGSNIAMCLLGESGNVYINFFNSKGDNSMTKIESLSNICRLFVTTSTDEQGRKLRTIVGVDINGNNHDICAIYSDTIEKIR